LAREESAPLTPDDAFLADPDSGRIKRLDDKAALALTRILVVRHPKAPLAYLSLGYMLDINGLPADAEVTFRNGLKIAPEDPDLWISLGTSLNKRDKVSDARKCWSRAGAIHPANGQSWKLLASSYIISGEYRAAIPSLEKLRLADRATFDRFYDLFRVHRFDNPDAKELYDHFKTLR
ncbi:MAG: tetratricopeptide repeat protein, partial [Verrucomicrobiaceae bacterium]